ncbi:MAG: FxsA family protein [Pseudomonadales bacterium]|jgi:UPF0716 protein FxsA|nr:FxsA family protein [Pseudomonadales bacterium]
MRGLFLLLLLAPIVELWFIIVVGRAIGALPAIALLFLGGIAGVALLRKQSFSTLTRAQSRLKQGEAPTQELAEGVLLALAGLLLLLPGFLSDIVGLALVVPPLRRALVHWLLQSGRLRAMGLGGFGFTTTYTFRGGSMPRGGGEFYEGEFTREGDPLRPLPPSASQHDDPPDQK